MPNYNILLIKYYRSLPYTCICIDIKQKIDNPAHDPEEATVIGYQDIGENQLQLTLDKKGYPGYDVNKTMLLETFNISEETDLEDVLASKVPFICSIVAQPKQICRGWDILSLEVSHD